MDRPALVRAVLERQKVVARSVIEAGPACRLCASYRDGRCANIALVTQEFEPATGRYREVVTAKVDEARSDDGLCGPEGLLFESRSASSLAWEAVGGKVKDGVAYTALAIILGSLLFDLLT